MGQTASVMSSRSRSAQSLPSLAANTGGQQETEDGVLRARYENSESAPTLRKLHARTVSVRQVHPVLLSEDAEDGEGASEIVIPLRSPLSPTTQADALLHPCLLSFLLVTDIGSVMACSKATATAYESEEVWRCLCGCAAAQFRLFLPRSCVRLPLFPVLFSTTGFENWTLLQTGPQPLGRKRFSTMSGQPGTNGRHYPLKPRSTFRYQEKLHYL